MQGWVFLLSAIVLEVTGTTFMKLSYGFTKLVPSIFVGIFYVGAIVSLTMALKQISVSSAYAIWSGFGTALIAGIGFIFFKEHVSVIKVISIMLIIVGVIGLNISGLTDEDRRYP